MKKPAPVNDQHDDSLDDLLDGLRALGLMTATIAQVAAAVKELYPNGVSGTDEGEVLRAVFLAIKCRDSADNLA